MKDTAHCWKIAARESTDIEVWSDSDWAGDRNSRRSTLSAVVKACGTTVAAKSRKSKMVCLSSCEAELDAAVAVVAGASAASAAVAVNAVGAFVVTFGNVHATVVTGATAPSAAAVGAAVGVVFGASAGRCTPGA